MKQMTDEEIEHITSTIRERMLAVDSVVGVEVSAEIAITVHTYTKDFSSESRRKVYDAQIELYDQFPDVNPDFVVLDSSWGN